MNTSIYPLRPISCHLILFITFIVIENKLVHLFVLLLFAYCPIFTSHLLRVETRPAIFITMSTDSRTILSTEKLPDHFQLVSASGSLLTFIPLSEKYFLFFSSSLVLSSHSSLSYKIISTKISSLTTQSNMTFPYHHFLTHAIASFS